MLSSISTTLYHQATDVFARSAKDHAGLVGYEGWGAARSGTGRVTFYPPPDRCQMRLPSIRALRPGGIANVSAGDSTTAGPSTT